jgi:hypothetical protein
MIVKRKNKRKTPIDQATIGLALERIEDFQSRQLALSDSNRAHLLASITPLIGRNFGLGESPAEKLKQHAP